MSALVAALSLLPFIALWGWLARLPAASAAERLGMTLALGTSATSAGFFVARWLGLPFTGYVAGEVAASLAVLIVVMRWRSAVEAGSVASPSESARRRAAGLLIGVISAMAALLLWREIMARPHGGWDGWAIWNPLAVFLSHAGDAWLSVLATELPAFHTDYPLLVPASVARVWMMLGDRAGWVPAAIGAGFTTATALIVVGSIWRLRGAAWASAAAALLLTPEFLAQGANQMADVPLACFMAASVVSFAGAPSSTRRSILAGVAAGSAAWTKNEGLAAALVLLTLFVAASWRARGAAAARETAADLAIGAGPLLVLLACFKLLIAPDNDVVAGLGAPGVMRYWLDGARVSFAAREMARGLVTWGGWPGPIPPVLLVALAWLAPRPSVGGPGAWTAGAAVLLLLAVFFVVYVMTPHSIAWHIQTSWTRLVTQLWPTMVWWAIAVPGPMRPRSPAWARPSR